MIVPFRLFPQLDWTGVNAMRDDNCSNVSINLEEAKKQKERERHALYRANNKEKIKRSAAIYRDKNREKARKASDNWKAANPDRARQAIKKWQQEHKDKRRASCAKWKESHYEQAKESNRIRAQKRRTENKEHCLEVKRKWAKSNPDKILSYNRNSKYKRKNASGKHNGKDIQSLFFLQKGKCAICCFSIKEKKHVDHIIPLAIGGTNDRYNLQLLCPSCNLKKNAQHPIDFMQSRGYLL